MKTLKKPLSLLMALFMCLGMFAGTGVTAFAAGESGAETGSLQDTADAARLHICRKYLCRPVNLLYTGVQP